MRASTLSWDTPIAPLSNSPPPLRTALPHHSRRSLVRVSASARAFALPDRAAPSDARCQGTARARFVDFHRTWSSRDGRNAFRSTYYRSTCLHCAVYDAASTNSRAFNAHLSDYFLLRVNLSPSYLPGCFQLTAISASSNPQTTDPIIYVTESYCD